MSIFENTVLVDKKVSMVNVILRYLCIALAIFCVLVSIIGAPCFIYLLVRRSYGFGGEKS